MSSKNNVFLGYFNIGPSESLNLGEIYFVEIASAKLVGKNVHLLVKVLTNDNSKFSIGEVYDANGNEFHELVAGIYEAETGNVVSVSTDALECVSGFAKLTIRDEYVVVDWSTFDAESLPVNELANIYA